MHTLQENAETIMDVVVRLDKITVRGEQNMLGLCASMKVLREIADELANYKEGEQNECDTPNET